MVIVLALRSIASTVALTITASDIPPDVAPGAGALGSPARTAGDSANAAARRIVSVTLLIVVSPVG
jgi:hypothetical protein